MENLRQVEITIRNDRRDFEGKVISGEKVLGGFHGWEDYKTEDFSCKYAIVELEDGKIEKFEPHQIKFTGKPNGASMFEDGLNIEN